MAESVSLGLDDLTCGPLDQAFLAIFSAVEKPTCSCEFVDIGVGMQKVAESPDCSRCTVYGQAGAVMVALLPHFAAAESRGRAAGYAEAVQRLRDDDRYTHWWSQLGPEHPEHRYWDFGRKQLADYLETVERLAEEPTA